jgi:hypothetical protein
MSDSTEQIRTMMQQWADGKLTDAQNTFDNIAGEKADNLVTARKAEIAATVYNNVISDEPSDPEMAVEPETEVEEPVEAEEHEEV